MARGAKRRQRLGDWLAAALVLCCGWGLTVASPAAGQNHPELKWQVIETDHFRVFFHGGLDAAAARTAEIAEAAYGPVTQLYRYEPDGKVRILLKDYDDTANGAAFFYLDTIEIWTTSLDHDFDLRGTSDWLSNVVTHEFVHIISLGAARKAPQPRRLSRRTGILPDTDHRSPHVVRRRRRPVPGGRGQARQLGHAPGHGPAHGGAQRRPPLLR